MSVEVAPIVEGHGDVEAVPVLLRLIEPRVDVKRPVRFPRARLLEEQELIRAGRIAASNITGAGAVLLVIDADEDCAADLGSRLETILTRALQGVTCRVALAVREFEAWIVGGDAGYNVDNPDEVGRLKGRIAARHGRYKETADQARFTARIDVARLQASSRSFRRLQACIAAIVEAHSDSDEPG
ncbi:MAG: hypothetical protein IPM13_14950 [Phycisphaerales bacterium]|nr:hypothetical protein [Phycisphaerales bacterium]